MLCLEIELLADAYRAALPDGTVAEWPPHPERVFSALVQAWGDGGRDPIEEQALLWLEQQGAPAIEADAVTEVSFRDVTPVYVPPNDQHGVWTGRFPERRRQARDFHAVIPPVPLIRLFWPGIPSADNHAALQRIAARLASIGHSASLARATFRDGLTPDKARLWRPAADGKAPLRVPHTGRLSRLQGWLGNGQRPQSGATQRYRGPASSPSHAEPPASWFGSTNDWFVFEDNDGPFTPDILGFAHVAQRVRAALMQLGPQPTPAVLSGHMADGAAMRAPHMAIVPLQNVGWPHSDGRLLGFAVVLPRNLAADERAPALRALAAFARVDQEEPRSIVQLTQRDAWHVVRNPEPSRASLRPGRWCRSAQEWASATPVLMDRFPTTDDPGEAATILAAACRNIGLPEPVEIEIHKYSALTGAESAYPARGHRSRPDWSFPVGSKLARRVRRHVVLRFAEPVTGPVILGAGRFAGFGLCLPVRAGGA
ncbi:MAG: type I-U CRISPR-associated protein Csb2 [Acetobacteraceae bacterium]